MEIQPRFPNFAGPIARGATISLAIRLAGIGIVTVQAILTARLLGPEGYGTVAFLLSLATILSGLALLGTEPLAVREVARLRTLDDKSALKGFLSAIRAAVVAAGLVGVVVWVAFTTVVLPVQVRAGWADHALFVALIFPTLALTIQAQAVLRGYGHVAMSQIPQMILRPTILVSVLAFAWTLSWDIDAEFYLITVVVANLVALALASVMLGKIVAPLREHEAHSPGFGKLGRDAAPFLAMGVMGLLLAEINTLMLALLSDTEQTGLFQPVARIAPLLMLSMQAVAVRYGPRISEFWTTGEIERLSSVTRKVTLTTTFLTALSAALLLIFADPLLGLFGTEFLIVAPALWWIAGAQVINAACGPVGLLLTMSGHSSQAVGPQLLGLLVNLSLGMWLIPSHGAEGAAMAMAGGIVTWNLAMLVLVLRWIGFNPSLSGIGRIAGVVRNNPGPN